MVRIGVAGVYHESNTFAPGRTELSDFQKEWSLGKSEFYNRYQQTKTSMGAVIDASVRQGIELMPLLYTEAVPSATVTDLAAQCIISVICEEVKRASDLIDGLILILHGAMVSETYQDIEGELLKHVRKIFPSKPIVTTIDLHAHISPDMVELSDIIVGYDTVPHVDAYDRALEAMSLLRELVDGKIHPTPYLKPTNLLITPSVMETDKHPMGTLMNQVFEFEEDEEVLNISVVMGYAYGDVSHAGMSILVTTNNNLEKAELIADKLAKWTYENRDEFRPHLYNLNDALQKLEDDGLYPTVIVESSDNVPGGAPADATHVLRALVERTIEQFVVVIADPEAVTEAFHNGVNSTICCSVGGKTDARHGFPNLHGDPVYIEGKVKSLSDGKYSFHGPYMSGKKASMGRTAVIEFDNCHGSYLILTEERVMPVDINHITNLGLKIEGFKVINIKSARTWKASFGPFIKQFIEVDTPGCCSANLHNFDYRNVTKSVEII